MRITYSQFDPMCGWLTAPYAISIHLPAKSIRIPCAQAQSRSCAQPTPSHCGSRGTGRTVTYALFDNHVAMLLDEAVYHSEHLHLGIRDTPEPGTAVS